MVSAMILRQTIQHNTVGAIKNNSIRTKTKEKVKEKALNLIVSGNVCVCRVYLPIAGA